MFGVLDLPVYLLGLVVVVLLPGPNSLYVLTIATRTGPRHGFAASAGVWAGDTVLMLLAAGGLASVLQSHVLLFGIVRWVGAGYLAWMGVGLLRAALTSWRRRRTAAVQEASQEAAGRGQTTSVRSAFGTALGISLLNPKAIIFFVSFFVQFVDPEHPSPWTAFLFLGVLAQAVSVAYLSLLVLSGARIARRLRDHAGWGAALTGLAGALFIGFAVKLAGATSS